MRLVFAGTPAAALPSLQALLDAAQHEVVAVITRPDAPAGRGRHLAASPVRELAAAHDVPVLSPVRLREPDFLETLRRLEPDCCPVVAYGALVPRAALDIPAKGWVNLHFSLLPAWRGAAPVQHALLHGDDLTGASVFRLEEGLDTGPVFGVLTEAVRPRDTAGDLLERLSTAGAQLLLAVLDGIEIGSVRAEPQAAEGVSLAPKITVADAEIDWRQPAARIDRLVRACTPAPGAWTTLRGGRVKLGPVTVGSGAVDPGLLDGTTAGTTVGTAEGTVILGSVQPAGRAAMDATAWARGRRLRPGDRLGS